MSASDRGSKRHLQTTSNNGDDENDDDHIVMSTTITKSPVGLQDVLEIVHTPHGKVPGG